MTAQGADLQTIGIERMAHGPEGVGRLASGKVAFVAGAAPGDVVRAEVVEDKGGFVRTRLVEVAEPGATRVAAPACDSACGGCPWAHLAYDAQLAAKRAAVVDALVRVGRFEPAAAEALVGPCAPSKRQWGYRNKVELACGLDASGNLEVGLYEQGTGKVVPVERCPLAHKAIERAPRALRGALRFALGGQDVGLFRIGVRSSLRTGEVEVALWTRPGAFPRKAVAGVVADALRATSIVRVLASEGKARKVKKVEALAGRGCWAEDLGGNRFRVSAPSFFQVNTAQAERLVEAVMAGLAPEPGDFVADLYSGVGTFTLPLAEAGCAVAAVESAGPAVRDLRRNAEAAGVDVEVIGGDAARELPELGGLDALVVDPPRAGLHPSIVGAIAQAAPRAVAYVSCNPQTWARDMARLAEAGYALESATPVDMFPQTYHVEVASILRRA